MPGKRRRCRRISTAVFTGGLSTEVSWWDLLLRPFRPVTLRRSLPATAMACLLVMVGVILERPTVPPALPPADVTQVDSVQPEQVEHALDAMEILNEFSRHVRTDKTDSKL